MIKALQEESILTICEDVADSNQLKYLKPGMSVVRTGEVSDKVYIIKTGLFKLNIGHNNLDLTIDYLTPGYVTGLVNLYQPTNYPCAIRSVTESVVYEWDRVKIIELMSIIPEVSKEIRKSYSGWGMRVVDRIRSLVFLTSYQRVASWAYDYNTNPTYRQNNVWQHLTVKDMSEFCNTSTEDFERAIAQLNQQGIIFSSAKDCIVKDAEALKKILYSKK